MDVNINNMYNISALGFFNDGHNINPGIVSIEREGSLNYQIDAFNTIFSELGIAVDKISNLNVLEK